MSSRRKRERINYAELESLPRDADVTRRLVREAVEPAIEAITAAMPAGPPVDTGLMAAAASLGGVAKTADAFGKASARIATALLSAGSCTLTPCQPPPPGVETVPQGTLLSADWMRATGFRRPVLVARAEDCGATLPPPAALPPQRLAELCAADDSPAQVMEVAAQAEEALGWSVASYVSQYWADPGSREALLALPAADLEGSALADAEDGWQLSDEESGAADDDEEEEEEEEAFVPGAYGMDDEEDDDDDGAMGEDFVDEDEDDEAFDEEDEDFNPRRKRAKKTTAKAKRAAAARGAPKAAKAASSSVKIKIGGGAAAAANPSVKVRIGAGRGASGAVPARAAATAQPAAPVRAAKPAAPVSARASVKAMRARVKAMRRR
ncbi:hypothetical protein FNF28_00781 [Cafeteria roenbergensis]|uniref:Uncharacterized protein n=1 Tax=Cafeteria roenbergensis TaxID=33653 RepID=A0A5A8E5D6_CAFRO|nr:hypothetical protein FNF28_00781 [Cafeteria roenbergensis]